MARLEAVKRDPTYDKDVQRADFCEKFKRATGFEPYPWQIDVSEALHYRLDVLTIAGTGSGKTLQFIAQLLMESDDRKKIWILSPLIDLQVSSIPFG
jgi:ATP-dependent helicase YprA (DUF1998 family)